MEGEAWTLVITHQAGLTLVHLAHQDLLQHSNSHLAMPYHLSIHFTKPYCISVHLTVLLGYSATRHPSTLQCHITFQYIFQRHTISQYILQCYQDLPHHGTVHFARSQHSLYQPLSSCPYKHPHSLNPPLPFCPYKDPHILYPPPPSCPNKNPHSLPPKYNYIHPHNSRATFQPGSGQK